MHFAIRLRGFVAAAAFVIPSLAIATTGSWSSEPVPGPVEAGQPAQRASQVAERLEEALARSTLLDRDGRTEEADTLLVSALADPEFAQAPVNLQTAVWLLGGTIAWAVGDGERSLGLLELACSSPASVPEAFLKMFEVAVSMEKYGDGAAAAIALARRWPDRADELESKLVYRLEFGLEGDTGLLAARVAFLDALFDAGWTLPDGRQASELWRELVLLKIQSNDRDRAVAVAARVRDADDILRMRIDRRYDEVLARLPADRLDLARAVAEEVSIAESAASREPRLLEHVMVITYLMLDQGQFDQVLRICDDVLDRAARAPDGSPYDDADYYLVWIKDNRAQALLRLGRVDEAVQVWEEARRMSEDGGGNVSQTINLAILYADLGRTAEALATLDEVGDGLSPFGWMQYHLARVNALARTPDAPAAIESLTYLQEHRADAASLYTIALLYLGRMDEAAQALVARLEDPDDRDDALLIVQPFIPDRYSPVLVERTARWRELVQRPEVQRAIETYGRIVDVPLYGLSW